jgi:hypothetical protein
MRSAMFRRPRAAPARSVGPGVLLDEQKTRRLVPAGAGLAGSPVTDYGVEIPAAKARRGWGITALNTAYHEVGF